jgi:4-hydroxy-3-methylbut-2-enyl diphosphate reductase IspH
MYNYSAKIYDIFISHAWKYSADYYAVENFIKTSSIGKRYRNYSVPKHDPFDTTSRLKEKLKEQVRQASVVIIIGGMYASHSDWIQYEIDVAKDYGKKILLINRWGQQRVPLAAQQAADKVVGWNQLSIVNGNKELC